MTAFKKKKIPSLKFIVGLSLALIGFFLPFLIRFEGLPIAGHFALSIFLLAAILWIFETIPIYATSLLVILLQVVLLSAQGPMFSRGELKVTHPVWVDGLWKVPEQALDQGSLHIKTGDRSYLTIPVDIVQVGEYSLVRSDYLNNNSSIVSNSQSRFIGYLPVPFTLFIGTLASPVIILFLAGFMLAAGAVKFNLDKNITSFLLSPFGQKPAYIVLGLMVVTASLSAFMSNTATTAMMMTVAIPIVMQINPMDKLRVMLVLSVPVAANLGGLITPIGTPPNAIVISALQQQGIQMDFGRWVGIMLPLAMLMLIISWAALQMLFKTSIKKFSVSLEKKLDKSPKAIFLYAMFFVTVLFWVTEGIHGIPNGIVALIPIAGLTISNVLTRDDIRNLPWEVLWLVAGGIALGISMENTGLAGWLVSDVAWQNLTKITLLAAFALTAWGFSVFLSNTVAATLLVPLAVSIAVSGVAGEGFNLGLAGLVIGAACNLAMVLPISTPPNAIAISTGLIKSADMVKIGLIVGLLGILITVAFAAILWPLMLTSN